MSFKRVSSAVAAALTLVSLPAFALTTIGFDDIDATASDVSLDAASPYQRLTWSNFFAYTSVPGFEGFNDGIVSLANAAYSGGEIFGNGVTPVVGTIQLATGFDFLGGDFGAAYYNGLGLTVTGYHGSTALYARTLTLSTTGAQSIGFDFKGIDRLTFSAFNSAGVADPYACGMFNCTQFTVDNVAVEYSSLPPSVPEPSSALSLLFGLGLLAAGYLRRRESP